MLLALTNVLGLVAFLAPLFTGGGTGGRAMAHASDAPYLFTVLGVLLLAIAMTEVRAGRMDAKHVAMLGVLAAINAVLRLPGSFGGASLMFVLPLIAGATFGARFGFLLGATSMAASGVITAGVGPWLPFQMWALGWVGAAGALAGPLVRAGRTRAAVLTLVIVGWVTAHLFGVMINLWFWPFQPGASDIAWQPGLPLAETIERYRSFYVLTSLGWDATRAIANAVLLAVFGGALIRVLDRFRARTQVTFVQVSDRGTHADASALA